MSVVFWHWKLTRSPWALTIRFEYHSPDRLLIGMRSSGSSFTLQWQRFSSCRPIFKGCTQFETCIFKWLFVVNLDSPLYIHSGVIITQSLKGVNTKWLNTRVTYTESLLVKPRNLVGSIVNTLVFGNLRSLTKICIRKFSGSLAPPPPPAPHPHPQPYSCGTEINWETHERFKM